jgi:periplasmic divalent cation tolerance protein
MTERYYTVFCSVADVENAERLAKRLVSEKLAACVQVLPAGTSFYLWDDQLQQEPEQLLVIKTHASRYAALEACILAEHPYELPEIIAVPLVNGYGPYLDWVGETLGIDGKEE